MVSLRFVPLALDAVARGVTPNYFGIPVSNVSQLVRAATLRDTARETALGPLLLSSSSRSKLPLNETERKRVQAREYRRPLQLRDGRFSSLGGSKEKRAVLVSSQTEEGGPNISVRL